MKKYILPAFYGLLILRPIFLGGGLLSNYFEAAKFVPAIAAVEAANLPAEADNTKTVWVTAYSSSPNETDDTPFVTATNKKVRDGFMAANFLPFGTKVKIPELFGDKIFVVEDRMSRRKTNFVDVWMPEKNDALEFGIHEAKILIVEMGLTPNPIVVKVWALPDITRHYQGWTTKTMMAMRANQINDKENISTPAFFSPSI